MIKIQGNNTPRSIILKQSLFTDWPCCTSSAAMLCMGCHASYNLYPCTIGIFCVDQRLLLLLFHHKLSHVLFRCFPVPSQYLHVTIPGTLAGLFTSPFASAILNHITINFKLCNKHFLLISVSQKNRESRHLAYLTLFTLLG